MLFLGFGFGILGIPMIDLILHITVGALFALAVCWSYWLLIPVTFVWAWLREQAQHRYILNDENRVIGKASFFGWMTLHSLWEAAQWTLGAAAVCVAWFFFGR